MRVRSFLVLIAHPGWVAHWSRPSPALRASKQQRRRCKSPAGSKDCEYRINGRLLEWSNGPDPGVRDKSRPEERAVTASFPSLRGHAPLLLAAMPASTSPKGISRNERPALRPKQRPTSPNRGASHTFLQCLPAIWPIISQINHDFNAFHLFLK